MQTHQNIGESNAMRQIWFKYAPYWPVFFLFLALAGTGAWFYLKFQTPLYVSEASILIKDEKKGNDESKIAESLNLLSSKKIVENEMEVLKSKELMLKVVKNLNLYAQVFVHGRYRDASAYSSSPVSIEAQYPDSLKQVKKVFFSYDAASKKVIIGNQEYAVGDGVNTPYGSLKFVLQNSGSIIKVPLYFSLFSPDNVATGLVSSLNLLPASKESSVIELKLGDGVPKRSEDILNELMKVYSDDAINDKNKLATNTLSWLN